MLGNSSITSVVTTGLIAGGNDVTLTSASSGITSTSFVATGLVLPAVPLGTVANGRCTVLWQMSNTTNSMTLGFSMNNSPTGLWTVSDVWTSAAGTNQLLAPPDQTATAATAISAAATAGAASTSYKADLDFTLSTTSNPVTVTLNAEVTGGTLTLEPGSKCYWLP
jgi:hypothetical protein